MTLIKKNVRHFDNADEYIEYYDTHEHFGYVTDIVEEEHWTCADAEYSVKNWKTAVKKLAAATGWDWVLGWLECEEKDLNDMFLPECDSVSITFIDDEYIYIAARQYK